MSDTDLTPALPELDEAVENATAEELDAALRSCLGRLEERMYETGVLLAAAHAQQIYKELPAEPPYADWADYVGRTLGLSARTARRYAEAASFSKPLVLEHKVTKMAFLRRIVDLTGEDESEEQAVALELPLRSGGTKRFAEMTSDEVMEAYGLLLTSAAKPVAGRAAPAPEPDAAAAELAARAEAATASLLQPDQVTVQRFKGQLAVSVEAFFDSADQAFEALASAMPEARPASGAEADKAPDLAGRAEAAFEAVGAKVGQSRAKGGAIMDGLSGAVDSLARSLPNSAASGGAGGPARPSGLAALLAALDKLGAAPPKPGG